MSPSMVGVWPLPFSWRPSRTWVWIRFCCCDMKNRAYLVRFSWTKPPGLSSGSCQRPHWGLLRQHWLLTSNTKKNKPTKLNLNQTCRGSKLVWLKLFCKIIQTRLHGIVHCVLVQIQWLGIWSMYCPASVFSQSIQSQSKSRGWREEWNTIGEWKFN